MCKQKTNINFEISHSTHQRSRKWLLLIILLFFMIKFTSSDICVPVYITVCSSKADAGRLELNWDVECNGDSNWIGLFEDDPNTKNDPEPFVRINISNFSNGFYRTDVLFTFSELPGGWHKESAETAVRIQPGSHCFPYWIASFKDKRILHTNCLKIQPTWMLDSLDKLNNMPFSKLLIPGTHNSGSYNYSVRNDMMWRNIRKFVITQEHDVWTQLVYGIRYLDFRIAYYEPFHLFFKKAPKPKDKRFWINHDVIRITQLVPVLRDIRKFLEVTTNEIVVLDIHRLPFGFYSHSKKMLNERHTALLDILRREFIHLAVDFKELMTSLPDFRNNPTVRDILNTGKRLIICYPDIMPNTTWLWPPMSQQWGNEATTFGLINYLKTAIFNYIPSESRDANPLWAVMAHLTIPNWNAFTLDKKLCVRNLADKINRNITEWVKFDWWHKTNIIATDYFLGNNLIELSINSNKMKSISYP